MIRFLLRCAGLVLAFITAGAAYAQDVEWKLNHNFAEARNESRMLARFGEFVGEESGGKMKVQVFGAGSLGLADADILRWLPRGGADIGVLSASFVGRDAPDLNAVYIQGSIGSVEEHHRALPVLEEIYAEAVAEWDFVPIGFMRFPVIDASIFCKDDPVSSLDQLRQKKLRVWSRDLVETFRRLGVAAQIIPQNDLYVALQSGVVDCALYPARFAGSLSLQEVTDHASYLFPIASMPYVIVTTEEKWNSLPKSLQQAVERAGDRLYQMSVEAEHSPGAEQKAREAMMKGGVKWHDDFPQEDREAFLAAAAETWAELAEDAGGNAPAWRQRVIDAIGR